MVILSLLRLESALQMNFFNIRTRLAACRQRPASKGKQGIGVPVTFKIGAEFSSLATGQEIV